LTVLDRELKRAPGQVIVQYVPHAFGHNAMNLAFSAWLFGHGNYDISIMFHEVGCSISLGQPLRRSVQGAVHRVMALLAARHATRVFVATPAWAKLLKPLLRKGQSVSWLPVPSNIPLADDPDGIARLRKRYAPRGGALLGHFGTFETSIATTLFQCLPIVLREDRATCALLLGRGGEVMRDLLVRRHSELADRIHATGALGAEDLSRHLSACDVMVQPYSDGITSRRGTLMACLAHGRPVLSTVGQLSEPLWSETEALVCVPVNDVAALTSELTRVLNDSAKRRCMRDAAAKLYTQYFDLKHTITRLRETNCEDQARPHEPTMSELPELCEPTDIHSPPA